MSGLHDALRAQRDTTRAQYEDSDYTAFMSLGAVADLLERLLEAHPPADLPVATGDAGTESAAAELRRLNEIGETRRDLISDEDWAWFCNHALRRATGHPIGWSAALGPVADWLDSRATSAAGSSPEDAGAIETLVERSSLGTPEAKALRATVSDERAAQIVARAKELEDAGEPVGLSEVERESIRAAMGDVAGHPFVTVVAEVERILAGRLAAAEQELELEREEVRTLTTGYNAQVQHGRAHYVRAAAAEQEAAALREQVAVVAAVVSRTEERLDHSEDRVLRFWARELSAAIADPASVLAQRDAEVGAEALERLADELPPWSPPYASLREQGAADGWRHAQDVARDRAQGLRQGVDRG